MVAYIILRNRYQIKKKKKLKEAAGQVYIELK